MTLTPHTRLGPYEIVSALGAGGMGEVYRARDTRLGREVAIKVLPQNLSRSPDFRARFEREAKTVSGLNHPHICTVHDVGREGDTDYLVMELIEGETLAHRLEKGALPVADVLRLGAQIADALDRAHRAGIVHRDLKPGNVMLTRLGAKLMDFGLARESDGAGPAGAALTVTKSQPLTAEGSIVGTFQYMAPERLEGKDADARSDVWALGCVLYEMATAKRAFEGKSQASLISAIMSSDPPPIEQLAPLAPPALDRLVHACLSKDPDERIQTAHDVRLQLGWIAGDSSQAALGKVPAAKRAQSARLAWTVAFTAAFAAAFGLLSPLWTHGTPERGALMRFSIPVPTGTTLTGQAGNVVISPDGKLITFAAIDSGGNLRLWVRPLASLDAQELPGTDNVTLPFWSPDSRFIAFFADGKLKKVPAAGGPVEALSDAPDGRGGTWCRSGVILFAPIAAGPIERVADTGGDPAVVARPDSAHGETALRFPSFLPDGKHYMFVALPPKRGQFNVFVSEIGSESRTLLTTSGGIPVYSSPYLILTRGDRLLAQRFDPGPRSLHGNPSPFGAAPQLVGAAGNPGISVSDHGVLVRSSIGIQNTELQWLDRNGRPGAVIPVPAGRYANLAISPDGQRALVERYSDANSMDLWMVDLSRALISRFTHLPSAHIYNETWSPDGSRIVFNSDSDGPYDIYEKDANGEGDERLVYHSNAPFKNLTQWTYDGRYWLFDQPDPATGWDIWGMPTTGEAKPFPVMRGRYNEQSGHVSPDGKWLAFVSDESGRLEAYVTSFPTPGARYQVSANGVLACGWGSDGKQVFFVSQDGVAYSCDVQTTPTFRTSTPHMLFRARSDLIGIGATYNVDRYIQVVPAGKAAPGAITVEVNWAGALAKN